MSGNEKKVRKRIASKKIKLATEGIFSTLFDITLFTLCLPLFSFGKSPNSRDVYKTFDEAEALLRELNYKKFKQALSFLRKKGFIESIKEWSLEPTLTAAGKRRLKETIPQYYTKRPWNGKLYLISYDFSTKRNSLRAVFREYIKRLGAIRLQDSLYLTFNNPYQFIIKFKKEHTIKGTILISELGREGFLGEKGLKTFIWEAAGLEEVNLHYKGFVEKYHKEKWAKTPIFKIALEYYSILKDDRQLPFKLLLDDYLGDEAYLLFKRLTKNKY